jgi:hypothetical protein
VALLDCGSGCDFDLERTIERHMSECITQLYLAHCQHLRAQEKKHLAQANRHIAELTVQRVIVKYALDTGQRSEMAESLLDALDGSLRIFEKHRELIFAQLQRQPSE